MNTRPIDATFKQIPADQEHTRKYANKWLQKINTKVCKERRRLRWKLKLREVAVKRTDANFENPYAIRKWSPKFRIAANMKGRNVTLMDGSRSRILINKQRKMLKLWLKEEENKARERQIKKEEETLLQNKHFWYRHCSTKFCDECQSQFMK